MITKSGITKTGLTFAAVLVVFLTRRTWASAAKVLCLAGIFVMILAPLCTKLEYRGMKKGTAAFLCLSICVTILAVFLLVFVPYLISGVIDFVRSITPTILHAAETVAVSLEKKGRNSAIQAETAQILASVLTPLTTSVAKGSAAFFKAAGHVVFSLVITYYALTIRETIGAYLLLLVPTGFRRLLLSSLSACKNAILSYLSGTLKTSAFVGGATLIGLLVLGVKEALILSMFMSILEILPYIGPVLGAIPILLSAAPMGIGKTMMALGLVLLIQQMETSVVGPYFTASSTSIHPLAAIICVFLGGSLFGVPGILLSIPALIVAKSIYWSIHSAAIHFDS